MADEKKVSGPWEWVQSDTMDLVKEYAIWIGVAAAVGALQHAQTIPIENPFIAQAAGFLISSALSWLNKLKKDNNAKP
jgi:hypothetical protein